MKTRQQTKREATNKAGGVDLQQPQLKQQVLLSSSSSSSSSLPPRKNRVVMAGSSSSRRLLRKSKAANNGKQQVLLSSSSSSSSSLPLRKNRVVMAGSSSSRRLLRKSKAANNGIHRWRKPEEVSLIQTVNELSPKFGGFTDAFCDAVADQMNQMWGNDIKFVSLDGEKVRYKMKVLKKSYEEAKQQGAGQEHVYAQLNAQFSRTVSSQPALQSNSKSSFSVGVVEDFSKKAALKYLVANGCPDSDLYLKYSMVLDDPKALELFWIKDTYEQKIALLDYVYNALLGTTPTGQQVAGVGTTPPGS